MMQSSRAWQRSNYNFQFTRGRKCVSQGRVTWQYLSYLNSDNGIDISDPASGRQFSTEQYVCNILKISC
jgi:hypothetical protein